jgi:hypothetical protein
MVVPFYRYPTNESARLMTLRLEVISSHVKKQERTAFVAISVAGGLVRGHQLLDELIERSADHFLRANLALRVDNKNGRGSSHAEEFGDRPENPRS